MPQLLADFHPTVRRNMDFCSHTIFKIHYSDSLQVYQSANHQSKLFIQSSTPQDVAFLASKLPHVTFNIQVSDKDFNHLDFIWGEDTDKLVFEKVLKYMPYF